MGHQPRDIARRWYLFPLPFSLLQLPSSRGVQNRISKWWHPRGARCGAGVALSLGQLVLFAILLTKKGWVQAGLVSPLFVVSLILCLFVSYALGKNVLDKGLSEEWATELSRASNGSLQEI